MGSPPPDAKTLSPLAPREAWSAGALAALSALIGILPAVLMSAVDGATRILAQF